MAANVNITCSVSSALWLRHEMAAEHLKLRKWLNTSRSYRFPKAERLERERAYESLDEMLKALVIETPKVKLTPNGKLVRASKPKTTDA